MTKDEKDMTPPLSRPVSLAQTPAEGLNVEIVANDNERVALARLNALPAVLELSARLHVRPTRGDGLEVDGALHGRTRQVCVLTLEEFESEFEAPVHARFAPVKEAPPAPAGRARDRRGANVATTHDALLEDDPPDPLIGGVADLGAIVSEFFTLALDPYPRKAGAEFTEPAPAAGDAASPFAALRATVKERPPSGQA